MQIGDLIKVKDCKNLDCMCFLCHSNSNRVGFIATLIPQGGYAAIFDIGEWDVFQFDEDQGRLEVMNESR